MNKVYEIEKYLVGKNIHSVYVYCLECKMLGCNMPFNVQCGNCNNLDTITYYDSATIDKWLEPKKKWWEFWK